MQKMVRISMVTRFSRIVLAFALVMAFAMHSPMACQAAQPSCHHGSRSAAPAMPCCKTATCISIDARRDAATPAPSIPDSIAPASLAYLTPRPPLVEVAFVPARAMPPRSRAPLVIELQTLLI
jgi:hypothetical protein